MPRPSDTCHLFVQCLEAEFYSWVAYGEGIYTVNSTLVGRPEALESQLCLPVHAVLNSPGKL